jgi:hypothetical protein
MGNACRERIADFDIEAVGERMLAAIAFARHDHSSDAI